MGYKKRCAKFLTNYNVYINSNRPKHFWNTEYYLQVLGRLKLLKTSKNLICKIGLSSLLSMAAVSVCPKILQKNPRNGTFSAKYCYSIIYWSHLHLPNSRKVAGLDAASTEKFKFFELPTLIFCFFFYTICRKMEKKVVYGKKIWGSPTFLESKLQARALDAWRGVTLRYELCAQ